MLQRDQSLSLQNHLRQKVGRITERIVQYVSKFAWKANGVIARGLGQLRGMDSSESAAFVKVPLTCGNISSTNLERLKTAILSAPIIPFSADDHARGYVFNENGDEVMRIFKAGYCFRKLDQEQNRAIAFAIGELAPHIDRKLGTGWRIINVKSWSIRPDTVAAGPNAWHVDGFPPSTFKIMIYLTPVGVETGTTEIRFADGSTEIITGEAGTYLLFDPSTLWHRGLPPSLPNYERMHIEVSLMRAAYTDARPVCGGLNSSFPLMPWSVPPTCRL